jgi:hypothetical protein
MKKLLLLAGLFYLALATPDCYDFSVTELRDDYIEVLPLLIYYGQVDWLKLKTGNNCGFYTYKDVFFQSYDSSLSAIYFTFMKGDNLQCNLDNTLRNFPSQTWLYANSVQADADVCGYFVGVANAGG